MFKKAERKQAKLRLAICGPSGSGKTLSALLIARGLAPEGRTAVIDTERGSAELYSHLYDYDVAPIIPPFSPQKYIGLIKEAEAANYAVVIIDSLSHAWAGEGGILEFVDKVVAASPKKDNFSACGKPLQSIMPWWMPCWGAVATSSPRCGPRRPIRSWMTQTGRSVRSRSGLLPYKETASNTSSPSYSISRSRAMWRPHPRIGRAFSTGQYWVPTKETGKTLQAWLDGASPERPVEAVTPTPLEAIPVDRQASEMAKQRIMKILSRAARARAWLQAEVLLEKEFAGDPETLAYARDQSQRSKPLSEAPAATAA